MASTDNVKETTKFHMDKLLILRHNMEIMAAHNLKNIQMVLWDNMKENTKETIKISHGQTAYSLTQYGNYHCS